MEKRGQLDIGTVDGSLKKDSLFTPILSLPTLYAPQLQKSGEWQHLTFLPSALVE